MPELREHQLSTAPIASTDNGRGPLETAPLSGVQDDLPVGTEGDYRTGGEDVDAATLAFFCADAEQLGYTLVGGSRGDKRRYPPAAYYRRFGMIPPHSENHEVTGLHVEAMQDLAHVEKEQGRHGGPNGATTPSSQLIPLNFHTRPTAGGHTLRVRGRKPPL